MYSRITVHTKSWNAFFRIRVTSFLPQTAGKEQRVWPLCELVRFDYSIYNRNLSRSRLLRRFFEFYDRKKTDTCVRLLQQKIKTAWKDGWRLSKNYRFSSSLSIETTLSIECWRKTEVHKVNCRIAASEGGLYHAPFFMNLLRKFYFMRAVARSTK